MPVYEFYCYKCHTIYNFYSGRVNTEKVPDCPKCKDVKLERQMSIFSSMSSGHDEGVGKDSMPDIDESKLEQAMASIAGDIDKVDENDPRQAAELMRKLSDATGLKMGDQMEEALSRMEKGEDPDKIEEEMGDLLESEEPFGFEEKSKKRMARSKPKVDDTLYEL